MRTIVYVDGYNLYYSLLRGTKFKWLDLVSLFEQQVLDDSARLLQVRYYTAPILARMCDDSDSPNRQRIYLQALRKKDPERLKIVEGRMIAKIGYQRLATPLVDMPTVETVRVVSLKEKKSDVNLAADLITGAWTNAYDQAVVCSNDTDLEAALSAVRTHVPAVRLGVAAPISQRDVRYISADLKQHAHWVSAISPEQLAKAQLPKRIPASTILCPEAWI